ncbi:hypothetical protein [Bradyrhizobium sp. BWA-3-5]|nr:hypothetical protein [Bradyrhizobium sp. BWA-3-5]WOH63815.1 hypothetical protein RX331_24330 [Bradyrhizobium sp. BWA-3-5]
MMAANYVTFYGDQAGTTPLVRRHAFMLQNDLPTIGRYSYGTSHT